MKKTVYAIVLAAGKSTRMQKQKLLLPFKGETIIRMVVKTAMQAVDNNVIVVLGSHSEEVRRETNDPKLKFILNPNYETGMLSSVICGFSSVPESAGAAMLFLGDQPHIPESVPEQLIAAWNNSEKGIIIPTYYGKRGHPVLIETKYKHEIKHLNPEKGLKELMEKFDTDVLEVECQAPEIIRDIDTPDDYQNEINKIK